MAFEQQTKMTRTASQCGSVLTCDDDKNHKKMGDHATAGLTVGDGKPKKLSPTVSNQLVRYVARTRRMHVVSSAKLGGEDE